MLKNAFYFVLKAAFLHKIFKLLFWVFDHIVKMAWLEKSS